MTAEDIGDGGDASASTTRQRVRQQISVPFLWEERPGKPKTGCRRPTDHHPPPLQPQQPVPDGAVCVPFWWEEKPGKPLVGYMVDAGRPGNPFVSNPEEEERLTSYLRSLRLDVDVDVVDGGGGGGGRRCHLPRQSGCTSPEDGAMVMHYSASIDDGVVEEEGCGCGRSKSSGGDAELHGGGGGGHGDVDGSVVEVLSGFRFLSAGLLGKPPCGCGQAPTLEELIMLTPKLRSRAGKTNSNHLSKKESRGRRKRFACML